MTTISANSIKRLDLNAAYALYPPSTQDLAVIHNPSQASSEPAPELEKKFISTFFKLAGQTPDPDSTKFLVCPRALDSVEILAQYLSENKYTVVCPVPLYPNTYRILREPQYGVPVEQIPEKDFFGPAMETTLSKVKSRALWITSPNNPTGKTLTKENFKALIEYCEKNRKLLILNTLYRFFGEPGTHFDQYERLKGQSLEYAIIEDTGKTLSTEEPKNEGCLTQGPKRSILAMSSRLFEPLHHIFTDRKLQASRSDLNLLTAIIENAIHENLKTVRENIAGNRATLAALETFVTPQEHSQHSLAWLKIKQFDKPLTASQLVETLWARNVNVL